MRQSAYTYVRLRAFWEQEPYIYIYINESSSESQLARCLVAAETRAFIEHIPPRYD